MVLTDRYDLEMQVGGSLFSKVYQATCIRTGCVCAIKIIGNEIVKHGSPSMEVDILKKCKHPNIIALREEFSELGEVVLVFPAYDMDLLQHIRLRGDTPDDFPHRHRISIVVQFGVGSPTCILSRSCTGTLSLRMS